MRFYPDLPRRRRATLAADLATLLAIVLFAWLGVKVHDTVDRLSSLGRGVQSAGRSVEGGFRAAGDAVGGAPVIGGPLKGVLQEAGRGTGGEAVQAGRAGERAAGDTANLLGWLIFLLPAGLLLSRVGPTRVAQVRALTAAARVLDAGDAADPQRRLVLAQRAAFALPYATLLRHTPDPLGDLAAGRHDRLVAAVAEDAGLALRPASV